jgi:hypothetical protein
MELKYVTCVDDTNIPERSSYGDLLYFPEGRIVQGHIYQVIGIAHANEGQADGNEIYVLLEKPIVNLTNATRLMGWAATRFSPTPSRVAFKV